MHIRHLAAALLLTAAGATAQAASVTLVPSATTVAQNGAFTVNLVLSAADAPGGHPSRITGQVLVDFNTTLLNYTGFTLASGLSFVPGGGAPVVTTSGSTRTVNLWFEGAPDVGTIGTFSFTAIGGPGSLATLGLKDADDFAGSFVNKQPTDQRFYPVFNGAQVNISAVPLPAGVWLLGTALAGLAARRRFRPVAA